MEDIDDFGQLMLACYDRFLACGIDGIVKIIIPTLLQGICSRQKFDSLKQIFVIFGQKKKILLSSKDCVSLNLKRQYLRLNSEERTID
jgi:hypothetical protein